MKKQVLLTAFLLSVFSMQAQEFFSDKRPVQTATEFTKRVNDISYDIDTIIKDNKEKLKQALNEIERQVDNHELSKDEAEKLRIEKAEYYARQIEEQTKLQEERIRTLINNKIEDNIDFSSDMSAYQKKLIEKKTLAVIEYYFGQSTMLYDNKAERKIYNDKFLRSLGVGVSIGAKTRVGDAQSRVFWKAAMDVGFNYFHLNGNKTIQNVDKETVLVDLDFPVSKSMLYTTEIKLSNYLEYDFSGRKADIFGNQIIKSRQSFFVGLGGYLGYSQLGKQLKYTIDGDTYKETTFAKYNANQFVYGVGAYVGYRNFSLRATYNLNSVFKKSFADQNILNISLGISLF